MTGMGDPVRTLLYGNRIMAVCGVSYLAWWLIVFRPPGPRRTPVGGRLLALAFLTGVAGAYLCGRALTAPVPEVRPGIRSLWIAAAGAVLYVVLLAGTVRIFHRPVTSELLIITAWTVLELCVVGSLYRWGVLGAETAVPLTAVVSTAALASLICYLLYYRLPYTAGYIDGCVPLVSAVMTIIAIDLAAARAI